VTVVSLPRVVVTERRLRTLLRVRVTSRARAVVAATSACALVGGVLVHLDARADLRAERAALTQGRLEQAVAADDAARSTAAVATAEREAAAAREALAGAVARVDQVRASLRTRTGQRDDLRAQLRAASEELEGVRGSLLAGFTELGLQGEQIRALDACLNGVSRALLQLAFEDDAGAAGSLREVAGPCSTASVALR
jgi:chromosome segregation ATPase